MWSIISRGLQRYREKKMGGNTKNPKQERLKALCSAFAELLCSRLCHDIANSAGSIGNGLEMLLDPAMASNTSDIMDLLTASSGELINRIKIYRVAYGITDARHKENVALSMELARHMLAIKNVDLKISCNEDTNDVYIPSGANKTILNFFIILKNMLIKNNAVSVDIRVSNASNEVIFSIECQGLIQHTCNHHVQVIQNSCEVNVEDVDISNIQAYYTSITAQLSGTSIRVSQYNKSSLVAVIIAALN